MRLSLIPCSDSLEPLGGPSSSIKCKAIRNIHTYMYSETPLYYGTPPLIRTL